MIIIIALLRHNYLLIINITYSEEIYAYREIKILYRLV